MTKEMLIAEIKNQIERLEGKDIAPDKITEFVGEFLKKNPNFGIRNLDQIDIGSAFVAYLCTKLDIIDLDIAKCAAEDLSVIAKSLDSDNVDQFISSFFTTFYSNMNMNLDVRNNPDQKEMIDNQLLWVLVSSNIYHLEPEMLYSLFGLFENLIVNRVDDVKERPITEEEKNELLKELTNQDALHIMMGLTFLKLMIHNRAYSKKAATKIDEAIEKYSAEGYNLPQDQVEKIKKKANDKALGRSRTNKPLLDYFYDIVNFYNQKMSYYDSLNRETTKALESYKALITKIATLDETSEIKNVADLVGKVKDASLEQAILQYVYEVNTRLHTALEEEVSTLEQDKIARIRRSFRNYGIKVSDNYIESLDLTEAELSFMLKTLSSFQIKDAPLFLEIIRKTTSPTLEILSDLHERKIIDTNFLINHPIVFIPESTSFRNVLAIVKSFTEASLNPRYLEANPDVLLAPKDTVAKSLSLMAERTLLPSINRTSNLSFLKSTDLEDTVDLATTLGYTDSISSNINLLNYPKKSWQRVAILQALGVKTPEEKLEKTLASTTFFLPDNKLDEYLNAISAQPSLKTEVKPPVQYTKTQNA